MHSHNNRFGTLPAILFWLTVWQIAAMFFNRSLILPVPTPVGTGAAMLRLFGQGSFWAAVGLSFLRVTLGFLAALLLGIVCGIVSARHRVFARLASPLLSFIRAIPVTALTIILFLWISRDHIPSVIAFFTVLPIVWSNVETGVLSLNTGLVEMARVFGMDKRQTLYEIILPGIRPFLASSVASGMGFAWKSGCAAEIVCRTAGSLGNLLWTSKNAVDYEEVFAVAFVIIFLSTILQMIAKRVMKRGEGQ